MATSSGDGTGALEKALDVLDAVGSAADGLSQSALADRLALPRTTVYRLLATLVARGLVRRDPLRKVYCLGFRCFEMARQAYATPDLVAAATFELRALRSLTGETTYLAALDGREVISLDRCDGAHSHRSAAVLGERKPVHCTSQGKAILSAMDAQTRNDFVRDAVLKPMTPSTITDRRRLQAELRITRTRGYAIDDEEIVLGVRCVGAPIVDAAGAVRGAISVAGPAWRLTRTRLELLGPEVVEAARRVGAQLVAQRPDSPQGSEASVHAVPGQWAFHGAHPRSTPDGRRVYWADVLAPAVHVIEDGSDRELLQTEMPIVGLLLKQVDAQGEGGEGLVVVHEHGAGRLVDGALRPLPWPQGSTLAVCSGSGGSIWAALSLPENGAVLGLVDAAGGFSAHWRVGETIAAMAWHAGLGALCASAPGSGAVLMLRPGTAAQQRLATLPKGSGRLGGLAVDAQGGVWAALADGWSVVRISAEGEVDRVIGLPVPCATDLSFSTADPRKLYITTSRQSVPIDGLGSAPWAGRVLETLV